MKQAFIKCISGKSYLWRFDDSKTVGDLYDHLKTSYSENLEFSINVGTKIYHKNNKDLKLTNDNYFIDNCTIRVCIILRGD